MFDLIAVAIALSTFYFLYLFRTILSFTIDQVGITLVELPPADTVADLLPVLQDDLYKLGFEGPKQLHYTETSGTAKTKSFISVFTHPEDYSTLWLHCPVNVQEANNPVVYWSTQLADKRMVISQAFDPFFEAFSTPLIPAQTLSELELDKQYQAHQKFVASFDEKTDPAGTETNGILYQGADIRNESLRQLINEGRVKQDKYGINRVSLATAFKMLGLLLTRSKPKQNPITTPDARLLALAQRAKAMREKVPGFRAQLGIFSMSILLSIGIGGLIWDLEFALILLGVVLFHETGHYMAMRAFGYRNVQIMALPLVGGVTIGYDNQPNAWRQTWMSLMGPLPGIVLGWVLVLVSLVYAETEMFSQTLIYIATIMLVVNYLNILPILPLDGGHVLQALLPPNRLVIKAMITFATCALGAWFAFQIEFYLLSMLALLQMLTIPGQIKMAKLVKELYGHHELNSAQTYSQRMLRIFSAQQTFYGPCKNAAQRITQAESILQILTTKPMKLWQRGIIASLLIFLLTVPIIAGLIWSFGTNWDDAYNVEYWEQQALHDEQHTSEYQAKMAQLSVVQLAEDILHYENGISPDFPAPSTVQDSQVQILPDGPTLPSSLDALYKSGLDLSGLNIRPVNKLEPGNNILDFDVFNFDASDTISVNDALNPSDQEQLIDKQELNHWLLLSPEQVRDYLLLLEPEQGGRPGRLLEYGYEYAMIFPSFRDWLEYQWLNIQENRYHQAKIQAATTKRYQALEGKNTKELLIIHSEATELPFYYQWLMEFLIDEQNTSISQPEPASDDHIAAVEQSLGIVLDENLKAFYQQHNGLNAFMLAPLGAFQPLTEKQLEHLKSTQIQRNWQIVMPNGSLTQLKFDLDSLSQCISVGGYQETFYQNNEQAFIPRLLWCPDLSAFHFLDLSTAQAFEDFLSWLRYRVALYTYSPIHDE